MREVRFHFGERDGALEKLFEGGCFAVSDAAGDDQIKVAKVGGNVVGEAVRSDPTTDVDADGRKLFFRGNRLHPDAGFAGNAISGNGELGRGAGHDFFEGADVPADVALDFLEIEDGVANDLTWAVISDVAAAIGGVKLDIFLTKNMFRGEKIGTIAAAAEGDDVGMFTEEEHIIDSVGFSGRDEALLEGVGVGVAEQAKVGNQQVRHRARSVRAYWSQSSTTFAVGIILRKRAPQDDPSCGAASRR